MILYVLFIFLSMTSMSSASFSLRRAGWLDKVVAYHKNKLFEDFQKLPSVKIKATLQPKPPGYVDSTAWDSDSVVRLLALIQESEMALPVRRALRKVFKNRRMMSVQESFKYFPSLGKKDNTFIYYDDDSGEYDGDVVTEIFTGEEGVIIVANPVEARLPSSMISISLLRELLENRAKKARYMPTTRKTIPWSSMTKSNATTTSTPSTGKSTATDTDGDRNKNSTGGTGATATDGVAATTLPDN